MRYVVAYNCWRTGIDAYYERVWEYLRSNGHDVRGFCLTLDPPRPRRAARDVDRAWRRGEGRLLRHMARLEGMLGDADVLINWHGSDIPADFIRRLPVHTVFVCNDDPESSHELSRPVAWAYDQCLVGNAAAVDMYRDWDCRHAAFHPIGFAPWDVAPDLTETTLRLNERDIDVVFLGERESPWRSERLNRLARVFPDGLFAGRGWPRGYIPYDEMLAIYARSKIGINIHNSTGPINFRLYQLPAHGVLQVCDNKSNLHHVFDVGKDIVGFETIGECIDLVKYYLAHDDERRRIALAGYRRAHRDYGILPVWRRMEGLIEATRGGRVKPRSKRGAITRAQRSVTRWRRPAWAVNQKMEPCVRAARHAVSALLYPDARNPWAHLNTSGVFDDVLETYYRPPTERVRTVGVKIGILRDFWGEHERNRKACEEMDVPYEVIDFTAGNWLPSLRRSDCDGFIVHPTPTHSKHKEFFDERLRVLAQDLGRPTWPLLEELWIYECKRRMAYWFQAHGIPHAATTVFYDRDEAEDFLNRTPYPLVYKANLGSSASGVVVMRDRRQAERVLDQAFGRGVLRRPGDQRDREWGSAMFQEYVADAREIRIIQIGGSWFGHEKVRKPGAEFHSGSGEVAWGPPPEPVLDLCLRVAREGGFRTMNYDVFVDPGGRLLINELQVVFGSYNPSQMYIDGKPGRYRRSDGKWVFEEGVFNRNGGANLRIEAFVETLESGKARPQPMQMSERSRQP